jgi:glycosyltransferase involved in cell wall biosynthesis
MNAVQCSNGAGQQVVSIIVPVFNGEQTIVRALTSVLAQTWRELEVIVIDDCSRDRTAALVAAIDDPRVQLISLASNAGAARARNLGVQAAGGGYCAFLDADDYWHPEKIARQLAMARGQEGERFVVASRCVIVTRGRQVVHPTIVKQPEVPVADYIYRHGAMLQTSTLLMPRALAQRVPFDEALTCNQDTDLMLRLEADGAAICMLADPLVYYDNNPRPGRVSFRANLDASLAWFALRGTHWSARARKGYFFFDASARAARAGHKLRALRYMLAGLHPDIAPRAAARRLVEILRD